MGAIYFNESMRQTRDGVKLFKNNPEMLEEMLTYHVGGYGHHQLGRKYGCDHSSIHFQCKKHFGKCPLVGQRATKHFFLAERVSKEYEETGSFACTHQWRKLPSGVSMCIFCEEELPRVVASQK